MSEKGPGRRSLHHVVMPVATLGDARVMLEALGFLVAADAVHPFGTKNACVFFADGTYIEPLAVSDPDLHARQAGAGNRFVARDRDFRTGGHRLPGFSGAAFASEDAEADHACFVRDGVSDGDILRFSRPFVTPDGVANELSFRLAFAGSGSARSLSLFTCEAVGSFTADRRALTRHPNGATGIARLVVSADDGAGAGAFLGSVIGRGEPISGIAGQTFAAGDATVDVLDPAALSQLFGRSRNHRDGALLEGLVVAVRDLRVLRDLAGRSGAALRAVGDRLVAWIGDGAFIAFEGA